MTNRYKKGVVLDLILIIKYAIIAIEQPLIVKADCNQKIGSRKRAFSGALKFS